MKGHRVRSRRLELIATNASLDCNAINDYNDRTRKGATMASITIRNLDEALKRSLRIRAAEHGRSMEEEARDILRQAMSRPTPTADLGLAIHRRFAALGGVDLDLPPREAMPAPPRLD
jgi:plasmid stability protein